MKTFKTKKISKKEALEAVLVIAPMIEKMIPQYQYEMNLVRLALRVIKEQ
jgi:hypothetical protein